MGEGTLSGQVAPVTGGTRGLGKEFVRALVAAGASLAVLSRNQVDSDSVVIGLAEDFTAAVGVEADVTDRALLEVCLEPVTGSLLSIIPLRRCVHLAAALLAVGLTAGGVKE
jgi:NAD(P)-dependent dehydrogenase (short-subunit alcohol dehydrogenase family)